MVHKELNEMFSKNNNKLVHTYIIQCKITKSIKCHI